MGKNCVRKVKELLLFYKLYIEVFGFIIVLILYRIEIDESL